MYDVLTLNRRRRTTTGDTVESIRALLFGAGEQGIYMPDMSDLTTLFQDRAGTTPVTAPGQSVGLILDKSQGLVLGPELVTNGDFSNGLTGWTSAPIGTGTATVVSGQAVLQFNTSANRGRISQQQTTVSGRIYEVRITVVSGTPNLNIGTTSTGGDTFAANNLAAGSYRYLVSSGAAFWVTILPNTASTADAVVDNISVRELPGFHAVANSDAARSTYQIDANGLPFILFDGADDGYQTPTITPGTDKVQVFAGVRKLSDSAPGKLLELSTSVFATNGSFALDAPGGTPASEQYVFGTRGTTARFAVAATGFAAPTTNVLTGLGDIAGDLATLRVNGTQIAQSTVDQGTGNYLAYPLFIGRRGGTTLPFNGRIYSLIVRFGPNLTADQIARVERFIALRTGVTI